MDVRIVVIDKGFIVVGVFSHAADTVIVERAVFVRRWGTRRGLGELAAAPALGILDPGGDLHVPLHAYVFSIPVDAQLWLPYLMAPMAS